MEVPRHWRLQKEKYGLVGTEFSCGHKVFPPRVVCPICSNSKGGTLVEELSNEAEGFLVDSFITQAVLAEEV